jgi:cyclophilin family peptidyl-prolyl cis-trans isomerase/HEAT repeat protein
MNRHRGAPDRLRAGVGPAAAAVLLAAALLVPTLFAEAPPSPPATEARAAVLALADARRWDAEQFARLAAHPDAGVRGATATAIGHLANADGVALIGRLAGDRDAAVRTAAAASAGRLAADLGAGAGAPLAATLEKLLGDADPVVRRAAAWGFARSGLRGWEIAVQGRFAGDSDPIVRAACLQELWRAEGTAWVGGAASALVDTDAGVRLAAAWSLARRGGGEATVALARVARDADPAVRVVVLGGASRYPDARLRDAIVAGIADRETTVRIQALMALEDALNANVFGTVPDEVRARLEALIARRDPDAVHERVVAVRAAGAARCCTDALLAVHAGGEPWIAHRALEALAQQDAPGADGPIAAWLTAAEPDRREAAVRALGRRGDAARLRIALADPSPLVRLAAVEQLAALPAAVRGDALEDAAKDGDVVVRAAAFDALAKAGALTPARAAELLAAEKPDGVPDGAVVLVRVLGAATELPAGAADLLGSVVTGPNPVVAREAWVALRRHGVARPLPTVATGEPESFYREVVGWAEKERWVELVTWRGTLQIVLDTRSAPLSAYRFAKLAGEHFFDNLTFHRVVPDFVVQGGDPRGDGWGGPGFALRDELSLDPYVPGVVGLALDGPDTGGSQLFVTLTRQAHLDGRFPVVGRLAGGLDVAARLRRFDKILRARVGEGAPPAYVPVWYGAVEPGRLDAGFPAYAAEREKYVPDEAWLERLRSAVLRYELSVAMGTWCGDSREQVPRLQKVLAALGDASPFAAPRLIAVDRSKTIDAADWPYGVVELVPTIVVSTGGAEIGRISETPASGRIEEDLARILAAVEGWDLPPPATPTPTQ